MPVPRYCWLLTPVLTFVMAATPAHEGGSGDLEHGLNQPTEGYIVNRSTSESKAALKPAHLMPHPAAMCYVSPGSNRP